MASEWVTIVWERVNKVGVWFPYSPEVCHVLEQSFAKKLNSVQLGDVDVHLKEYIVYLKDLTQVSETTGTICPIRRRLCDEGSAIAKQALWQWRGDGHNNWCYYSSDMMTFIENAFQAKEDEVDLSRCFPSFMYKIYFGSMTQKNKKTKYHRPIKRISTSPYPRLKISADAEMDVDNAADESIPATKNKLYPDIPDLLTPLPKEPAKKNGLVHHVSHLWNKLIKSSDSDSESTLDGASTSGTTKKDTKNGAKKGTKNGGASQLSSDCVDMNSHMGSAENLEYALVNGKSWKQPWPPHTEQSHIKPVPGIEPLQSIEKRHKRAKKGRKKELWSPSDESENDVFDDFTKEVEAPPSVVANEEEHVCIICYESIANGSSYDGDSTLLKLRLCSHIFHKSCIKAMYESGPKNNHLQCPTCKTIHGIKKGIQPHGTMVYDVLPYSLPGHHDCETIRIIYDITGGFQGPEHPYPGSRYSARGFPRHCYLPDNEIGRKILRLLIRAWQRRLIFTIGSSSTTGEQNTVTWNEIHHKTEFGYNRHGHGYPDPNYFENVIAELESQGVTETTYDWLPA